MLDNPYLDTIISLVLVYATLSILVSMAVEWLNKGLRARGKFLKEAIDRMIHDPNDPLFGKNLYALPLIASITNEKNALPAYISSATFATAFTDLIANKGWTITLQPQPNGSFKPVRSNPSESLQVRFRQGVASLVEGEMKTMLLGITDRNTTTATGLDLEGLRKDLARWYDDHMDRVTGQYKDHQRWKFYVFGFLIALALNVDSVHLVRVFFLDKQLRESMVARAEMAGEQLAQVPDSARTTAFYSALVRSLQRDTTLKDSIQLGKKARAVVRAWSGREEADKEIKAADSLLAAVAQWGLPIGWEEDEAPLIWCAKNDKDNKVVQGRLLLLDDQPLFRYFNERAQNNHGIYALYWLLGICMSGLALSAGAPFWFETMVKLINVRRAGVKPERADAPKKQ